MRSSGDYLLSFGIGAVHIILWLENIPFHSLKCGYMAFYFVVFIGSLNFC